MRKYLVEAVGTFFLVLTVGLCVSVSNAGAWSGFAIGSVLMVMVFAGGHVSGGHYNPAVTLAVWLRGKCDAKDVPGYMAAQVAAGVVAALVVGFLRGGSAPAPAAVAVAPALVAEFLFTFALCWVVLHAATTKANDGNSFFGLAIGFTVGVGVYAVGPISGGVFNPAVAVGISVMGLAAWGQLWIFLLANLAGGAAAAGLFRAVVPHDR